MDCDIAQLEKDLIRDEGLRLKPYVDTVGKASIGVGRNLTDVGITEAEALILLSNDISRTRWEIGQNLEWFHTLSEARQRALLNMAFNMGWLRLSGFKDMLAALKEERWEDAARASLDSKWADQTDGKIDGKDGQRAERIATLIREG